MKAIAAALLLAVAPAAVAAGSAPATRRPPAASVDDATRQAKAHFARGAALYKQARYREAIAEFEAAYRLRPHGDLFYNLAQCHERLGDLPAALRAYHDYLRAVPDAEDRATVRQAMANLESRLEATGVQQLLVYTEPPGADVHVDGQLRGRTPFSVVLPHGAHVVSVVKPGFAPVHRDAVLAPGVSLEIDLRLLPAQPLADAQRGGPDASAAGPSPGIPPALAPTPREPPAGLAGATRPPEPAPPGPRPRIWTWVATGIAAAALAGGIVYGLSARSASDELRGSQHDAATAQRLADTASSRARTANILYGVAAGAGAAGVGLFIFEGHF